MEKENQDPDEKPDNPVIRICNIGLLYAGVIMIITGLLLWLTEKLQLFTFHILEPLILLILGLIMVIAYLTHYLINRYKKWGSNLDINNCNFFGL